MSTQKSIEDIVEEFKDYHADLLSGRLSPLYLDEKLRTTLQSERDRAEEEKIEAVERQKAMVARHIDEIMKVITNPHELVDWLIFYRNTLTNPQDKQ